MPVYEVEVIRIGYGSTTVKVAALSSSEAEATAHDDAGSHSYSEYHAEYQVESVTEIRPLKTDTPVMSAEQLADKYAGVDGSWGEHPDFKRSDWIKKVQEEDTLQGYWSWVNYKLNEQLDEELAEL
jgi:hypothetical protein